MASAVIHICVANEINKILKKDKKKLLIGSIAPDISKELGNTKIKSHFQDADDNIPNIDKFLLKYFNNFDDDFVLGYYIHLYTDYLWFKYFVPDFLENGILHKLNGTTQKIENDDYAVHKYFYNDYSNLNITLIDEYNLDLKIFYEEIPKLNNIIKEIPMNKINVIVEKTGMIIEDSKKKKTYVFDLELINKFISSSVEKIISELKELMIIK